MSVCISVFLSVVRSFFLSFCLPSFLPSFLPAHIRQTSVKRARAPNTEKARNVYGLLGVESSQKSRTRYALRLAAINQYKIIPLHGNASSRQTSSVVLYMGLRHLGPAAPTGGCGPNPPPDRPKGRRVKGATGVGSLSHVH